MGTKGAKRVREGLGLMLLGGLVAGATGCLTSTGQPCESDSDCQEQGNIFCPEGEDCSDTSGSTDDSILCLTDEDGFPGGYCTTEDCSLNGCPILSECFAIDLPSGSKEVCLALCDSNNQCDRDGYECFDVDGTNVCLPADGVGQGRAKAGEVGAACAGDSECEDNGAVCLSNLPSGYCSVNCDSGGCPTDSHCEQLGDSSFCYRNCDDSRECRPGYQCSSDGLSAPSCVPEDGRVVKNPNGRDDGEPCVSGINCKGGVCVRDGEGFPEGYCTTLFCDDDNECNGGVCVTGSSNNACRSECGADADCREGYRCVDADRRGYCMPETSGGGGSPSAGGDIAIECVSGDSISFTIPAGSAGFYIAPFNNDGAQMRPARLRGDNGVNLDLIDDYGFYSLNPELLVSITPLLFPGSDEDNLEGGRDDWGGSYTLDLNTSASEVCYYIINRSTPGTTIDVNFYLVGVPGVTASNAGSNGDFQEMIDTMREIYAKAGISLGEIRYNELTSAQTTKYRVIRDFYDGLDLVTLSKNPGPSRDELLSINVFLIEDFNIPDLPGLLGFSPGLPGVSGAHGAVGTGLVFTSANLDRSPSTLGQTMAHEIGHFLGLRHTTEHGGSEHDPISDTPECSDPQNGTSCRDHRNFMFPFSITGVNQEGVTDGQTYVLKRSALVK